MFLSRWHCEKWCCVDKNLAQLLPLSNTTQTTEAHYFCLPHDGSERLIFRAVKFSHTTLKRFCSGLMSEKLQLCLICSTEQLAESTASCFYLEPFTAWFLSLPGCWFSLFVLAGWLKRIRDLHEHFTRDRAWSIWFGSFHSELMCTLPAESLQSTWMTPWTGMNNFDDLLDLAVQL